MLLLLCLYTYIHIDDIIACVYDSLGYKGLPTEGGNKDDFTELIQ